MPDLFVSRALGERRDKMVVAMGQRFLVGRHLALAVDKRVRKPM